VIGDIYKDGPTGCPGGACGSAGQTGRFTFSNSDDTKSFLWGWTSPPTRPLALPGSTNPSSRHNPSQFLDNYRSAGIQSSIGMGCLT
jgi:hypothetical protein